MIPSTVVVLEQPPLTANGTINRAALPVPGRPVNAGAGLTVTSLAEEILCTEFAEVLGLDQVGPEDDFFELGGHSLLAIQLLERLRVRGVHISMPAMIAAPTPAELVNQVDLSSVKEALSVLLPIRTRGTKPPLFCIHPAGGISWCYLPLARHVPPERPLYGLQASGLDGIGQLACTLTDMAAHYIEQIRAVQRTGPYHLLGWSFGGMVAHEIAIQLKFAGEQVTLAIMDTYPPDPGRPVKPADTDITEKDPELIHMLDMIERQDERASDVLRDIIPRLYQNNVEIMRKHEFGKFEGDLLLVASKNRGERVLSRWAPFISGEITKLRLPCGHLEMTRPDMLAQVWHGLSAWLAR
jgi:thioesterase domain-containing protein/aryl carrier-like protein